MAMDEAQVKRIPPHATDAERSVIGAMILRKEAATLALESLTKEDFYEQQYGQLFEAMRLLNERGRAIDPVTLKEQLSEMNVPESIADQGTIRAIVADLPSSANAEYYVEIVREKAALRRLLDAAAKIETDCYRENEQVEEIMDAAEKGIFQVLQQRTKSDYVPIRTIAANALGKIEKAALSGSNVTGLPTGFADLDRKTSGFQNSDLILIAARPSMGKTAFALNICEYLAFRKNFPVALFSLEMSAEQLMNRLFAMEAQIDSGNIRTGHLRETDWEKLVATAGDIGNSELIIDDTPGLTIRELRSKARRYKLEKDIKAIFIDYLQLMTSGAKRGENRQQEVAEISRALKSLARELDIPIIALSQLNRLVEMREDHRPVLSDLRESGAIEQDADVVMFIHREEKYEKDSEKVGIAEIIIGKQRNGPIGSVELAWIPEFTRFRSLSGDRKEKSGQRQSSQTEKDGVGQG